MARRKITPERRNNGKNYWSYFKEPELTMLLVYKNCSCEAVGQFSLVIYIDL